jgi:hypothetical protein
MQRRKYLAAIGSLAAGGAAAMGTGAFDNVTAPRSVNVSMVGDASASLSLNPISQYANQNSDGELTLNFGNINPGADVEFFDVFEIQNAGDKGVAIFLDEGNGWAGGSAEYPLQGTIYQNLADEGMPSNGWFDDDTNDLGDINGPDAMPSAYRDFTPNDDFQGDSPTGNTNSTSKAWNPATDPHILRSGDTMTPDFYIHNTDPKGVSVAGELVIWAFSKEWAQVGKGP